MGLYDREYYRDTPGGGGLSGGIAPACKWLIAINIAVFVLQLLTAGQFRGGVTDWFVLDPVRVIWRFEIWRLVTYAFCHDRYMLSHLVGNMFFLWICGRQVEPLYGSREFVRFYLTAAVLAGVVYLVFGLVMARLNPMLGASGAVMAVAMLCALYYPTMEILFMLVFPIQLRWLVAGYVVFDLYPVLRQIGGEGGGDRVAHVAHLAGLLYGYLYKHFDLRYSRLMAGGWGSALRQSIRNRTRRRPKEVRLYEPPRETKSSAEFERQVDEILAKIGASGEASLTDAERLVLKEASQRYKRR